MTGIDTNILVDLAVASSPHHSDSVKMITDLEEELCTTPTNIGECLRLLTHPRVFEKPLTISKAVQVLEGLFNHYKISTLEEGPHWWKHLIQIEKEIPGIRGNEIFDARIALCLKENGVKRIYTRDADFRKYSFLRPIQDHSIIKKR